MNHLLRVMMLLSLLLFASCSLYEQTRTGIREPVRVTHPKIVVNGDFTISGWTDFPCVGDVEKDKTIWTFDFRDDPFWNTQSETVKIWKAELSLSLIAAGSAYTDAFSFGALSTPDGALSSLRLPQGQNRKDFVDHKVNLLKYFSSDAMLEEIREKKGEVPAIYSDDALIYGATLKLWISK